MSYRDDRVDLTDIGVGEEIARQHANALRYIATDDQWLAWEISSASCRGVPGIGINGTFERDVFVF